MSIQKIIRTTNKYKLIGSTKTFATSITPSTISETDTTKTFTATFAQTVTANAIVIFLAKCPSVPNTPATEENTSDFRVMGRGTSPTGTTTKTSTLEITIPKDWDSFSLTAYAIEPTQTNSDGTQQFAQ